ncbi:MAG: hypothetical protein K2N94_08790 [Lachnospiraceae bacterium]|nr:hypothetical protein [Lachnospiraceae bacterium]
MVFEESAAGEGGYQSPGLMAAGTGNSFIGWHKEQKAEDERIKTEQKTLWKAPAGI